MSNEEVCQFQFACFFSVVMNGGFAVLLKVLGLPPEWWIISAMIAIACAAFGGCTVLIRGYMPKDKIDWDGFGAFCYKKFRQEKK